MKSQMENLEKQIEEAKSERKICKRKIENLERVQREMNE